MPFQIQLYLTIICMITTSLLAGLYFIFHNTLMTVFKEQEGSQIMRRINEVIINKNFLIILMLSPISALNLLFIDLVNQELSFTSARFYGEIFALLAFLITALKNVPLNNRLAQMPEHDPTIWQSYLGRWPRWNSIRYYLSLWASVLILIDFPYQ